jgi:hypothetical protein
MNEGARRMADFISGFGRIGTHQPPCKKLQGGLGGEGSSLHAPTTANGDFLFACSSWLRASSFILMGEPGCCLMDVGRFRHRKRARDEMYLPVCLQCFSNPPPFALVQEGGYPSARREEVVRMQEHTPGNITWCVFRVLFYAMEP